MTNVKSLCWNDQTNSPGAATVKVALENAFSRVDVEEFNKAFIILLRDTDGYQTGWVNAGMKMSECVALLEIVKTQLIDEEFPT